MAVDADTADLQLTKFVSESPPDPPPRCTGTRCGARAAVAANVITIAVLAALAGWYGYHDYRSHRDQLQRNEYLEVARQAALNLTTIDYAHAKADVQRILDSATSSFRDDFQARSGPFVDVVTQAKSTSKGSIIEAGVESQSGDHAQILVALTVNTSVAGVAEPSPLAWRMRLTVQRVGAEAKVANVEFVP